MSALGRRQFLESASAGLTAGALLTAATAAATEPIPALGRQLSQPKGAVGPGGGLLHGEDWLCNGEGDKPCRVIHHRGETKLILMNEEKVFRISEGLLTEKSEIHAFGKLGTVSQNGAVIYWNDGTSWRRRGPVPNLRGFWLGESGTDPARIAAVDQDDDGKLWIRDSTGAEGPGIWDAGGRQFRALSLLAEVKFDGTIIDWSTGAHWVRSEVRSQQRLPKPGGVFRPST